MPALALSQIDYGGPCKIAIDSAVIYFEDGVKVEPQPVWREIDSNVGGSLDDVLVDLTYKITGRPKAVWTAAQYGVQVPTALTNWTVAGNRIVGTGANSCVISASDANGMTFGRAKVTKPTEVFLGLGAPLYGEMEITAFWVGTKTLVDTDAFYTLNTTAWDQSDQPTAHQEQMCSAVFGAVTGFEAGMMAENGFKLTHELKTTPVKQGNVTVDLKIQSYRGMISFNPQKPTTTQLLAQFALQNAAGGIGTRRSTGAATLTVSGTGISVALATCNIHKGSFMFDNKANRHGEFAFITSATTAGTRVTCS